MELKASGSASNVISLECWGSDVRYLQRQENRIPCNSALVSEQVDGHVESWPSYGLHIAYFLASEAELGWVHSIFLTSSLLAIT